jgi:hypothetical protein
VGLLDDVKENKTYNFGYSIKDLKFMDEKEKIFMLLR